MNRLKQRQAALQAFQERERDLRVLFVALEKWTKWYKTQDLTDQPHVELHNSYREYVTNAQARALGRQKHDENGQKRPKTMK